MSSVHRLDPWTDAAKLAQRLSEPGTELLIVLGAETWCEKCRRLRPAFDALTAGMSRHILPMWLDLEDHADFLHGFIPPDLPLLLRWRQGVCVQAAVLSDIQPEAPQSEQVKLRPLVIEGTRLRDPHHGDLVEIPLLWAEFSAASWASGT